MICEQCKGDGRGIEGAQWVKCSNCNGTGHQPVDPALVEEPVDMEESAEVKADEPVAN